jgi:branched-chain amino acid transport system ATP-binding protein
VRRDKAAVADDIDTAYSRFPAPGRAPPPAGRHAVGRRAADAGHQPRTDAASPKLLLLDEPSFGLAPLIVAEIFRILRSINKHRRQVSMLLVEQNASLALDLAHHAYLLETGTVVMSARRADQERRGRCAAPTWATENQDAEPSMEAFIHQITPAWPTASSTARWRWPW